MKKEREMYIDILRIVCSFAVVLIHVDTIVWYDFKITSSDWAFSTFIDVISRFCLPVFFMISGALFLSKKEINIKKIYSKNILKILIIMAIWLPIYGIISHYRYGNTITGFSSIKTILTGLIDYQFQFWFLFPLITMYMCLPFLKKICEDKKVLEYYLILFFIFVIMKQSLIPLLGNGYKIRLISLFQPNFVVGYTGYFLLGYYLYKYDISKKNRNIIHILSIISIIVSTILTVFISRKTQMRYDVLFGYLMINVAITSVSVFLIFKYGLTNIKLSNIQKKIINILSSCTLGIYIYHNLIKWGLEYIGVNIYILPAPLSIILLTILVFVLSIVFTIISKKIPIIGKYIV